MASVLVFLSVIVFFAVAYSCWGGISPCIAVGEWIYPWGVGKIGGHWDYLGEIHGGGMDFFF